MGCVLKLVYYLTVRDPTRACQTTIIANLFSSSLTTQSLASTSTTTFHSTFQNNHPTATMQFSLAFLAAVLSATSVSAAPTEQAVNMMAAAPQWTIESMQRSCAKDDSSCTWNFKIDTHKGAATACKFVVKGSKASQRNGGPVKCGDYTVTSGWSGQFGPGNGFTTFSVVSSKRQIVWPAYTDKQVQGGKVVKPDQSYAPANLPN
ncbi:unnamed protein product [Fusarium graminearum]|nr:unnamed protein product [Fusarium graminearum]